MPSIESTVRRIVDAPDWDARVAQIRLVSERHGTGEHSAIFAAVAKEAYVPHLAPDFAYIHEMEFYDLATFEASYFAAHQGTAGFTDVTQQSLVQTLLHDPRALLALRTILGLTTQEFASATALVAGPLDVEPITVSRAKSMERSGTIGRNKADREQTALVAALTLLQGVNGTLFGDPPGDLRSKQQAQYDTTHGWDSVQRLARDGVPYPAFLHQRHYGGHFRQILDATSTKRGNLLEDAVEELFLSNGIPHIRTGAHNQGDIAKRFEIRVAPAPDFVVYDQAGALRAMLECKLTNDGGTARDKALRFERLRAESIRLGGIPLLAVLAGLGWSRVNDTLGPVIRDTDGRVFTLSNLQEMLNVSPFPTLIGTATS